MSIVDERSSFPTECKLAFGSSDKKQHTNLLKWTEDLEVYGKSKFGVFATIFRISAYSPTPEEKSAAVDDEFLQKKIFITMDERSKLTTEWRFQKPKLGSYLISALTEACIVSIQEKHRIAWTGAVQEDDKDYCAMRDCNREHKQLCGCTICEEKKQATSRNPYSYGIQTKNTTPQKINVFCKYHFNDHELIDR